MGRRFGLQKLSFLATAAVLCLLAAAGTPAPAEPAGNSVVTVFAAASLKTSLDAISQDFQKTGTAKVAVSYAASSALAKQIAQSAPADIFISADMEWMDDLSAKGLIDPASRTNLIGNRLVLIAPADSSAALTIADGFKLAEALGDGRLAVGDTKAVPAGKYAKAALTALGVWGSVEGKLAQAENVRAALALVARGEAPLGIVYQSDAAVEPKVKVLGTFPETSHPPIVYPVAIVAASQQRQAAASFVAFLKSESGQQRLIKDGFVALIPSPSPAPVPAQ